MKKISLIIFILLGITKLSYANGLSISATVDRTVIPINQVFKYTLEISGENANSLRDDPKLPDISAFANYMGSSGTSQNIQIINNKMSITKSMSFTYMASKIGKFQIPPAELKFKGKIFRTQPITIEIVQQGAKQPQTKTNRRQQQPRSQEQPSIEDNLLLRVFVSKKNVYVNEPVILTYKIYTALTVTSYGVAKEPNTTGFWAEEVDLGKQPQTKREMYKGREFLVAEIKRTILFPTDPGEKTITPMQIECDVRVQTRNRSVFDSFFDDPFFGRSVRHSVYSAPVKINVQPLPSENKPGNFSGIVGNFSITSSIDRTKVKTNEALAYKIKIAGTGNIKIIPQPTVEIPNDFEQYEPKISQKINRKEYSVSGSKTFEYVLIPRFPGIQRIKPVKFSYFDTRSKSYKTIQTKEIVVDVEKGNEDFVVTGSGLSKEEVKLLGQDIRFIQKHIPEFQRAGRYFYNSYIFYTLAIFPLLLVGASLGYRQHLDKISQNVAYARSRKANQMAMTRLKKAKKALSEKTQKNFYAETSNALLGFLADKLNIAAAGIITDQVEEMMKSRNIDLDVISQYLDCLQTCDYQRFAPSNSSLDEMNDFYNQAKKAIIALEKVI